jgi:tetratricopeptide (TPR) repeat protein
MLGHLIRNLFARPAAAGAAAVQADFSAGSREMSGGIWEATGNTSGQKSGNEAASTARRAMLAELSAEELQRAANQSPGDPEVIFFLALALLKSGEPQRALACCQQAFDIAPDYPEPAVLMSRILLGGEHYVDLIGRIIAHLKPRTYVEVGIYRGTTLALTQPPTLAIGIDPDPRVPDELAARLKIFRQTSDEFFATHDLRAELGGRPVDLAFIDGMHQFDFALRDFANIERHSTPDTTVLIHDCFPLNRETASRERQTAFWSGDIWRLIVLLKKYRPDLKIHAIGAPPTGLGLIRGLDATSHVLLDNHDRLRDEFLALDFSYLEDDKAGKLNFFPNDWPTIQALLR